MKKNKGIRTTDDEIPLPEAMIQHIQSFLSGKEAARTTVLSKSWYNAWLTCPAITLDSRDFNDLSQPFKEFMKKTMRRYRDLSLKIESFRLHSRYDHTSDITRRKLIISAMKMGATDLQLELPYRFTLPQEVLGSEVLLKLSIGGSEIDGKCIGCSRLKSLSLKNVVIRHGTDYKFKDLISSCNSLEELSLSECVSFGASLGNLHELNKLTRLFLHMVPVDSMLGSDFASKFPCLKDLSILSCFGRIQIASTSLQTIIFTPSEGSQNAKFDVPNIQKFTYSASSLPSHLSVKGASREWELDISIVSCIFHKQSWFLNLKKALEKFRLSRIISLSIKLYRSQLGGSCVQEVDFAAVPEPIVVENLTVNAPSTFHFAFLLRLFGICRPKSVTLLRQSEEGDPSFDTLCETLMHQVVTPNCGIPDQDIFRLFGLKKVTRDEVSEKYEDGCMRGTKTRFELIWEDF